MTRSRIAVTAAGVLSPLGDDSATLHRALVEGRCAVAPLTAFEVPETVRPLAAELNGGAPERYLEGKPLRPLDRPGRLATAAAHLALGTAGGQEHVGLVLGTMFGGIATISKFDRQALTDGPQYTRPFDFANSVINAAAGQTAIWHGLAGINATVGGGAAAGAQALAYAADLLRAGRAEAILAGGAEELCFESFYGFARAGLSGTPEGVPVPFHARRDGFVPGEGAALLRLEGEPKANAPVLGWLAGSGCSFDPSLGRDAARLARAIERAIATALADAGVGPEEIDLLSVSASGSPTVDRAEAAGLARALGARAGELPVVAVKAALGESLGAGGALQAVVAFETMARGVAPGIVGLDQTEPGLPLALAGPEPRTGSFRRTLLTSCSWDGVVSALVLEGASS